MSENRKLKIKVFDTDEEYDCVSLIGLMICKGDMVTISYGKTQIQGVVSRLTKRSIKIINGDFEHGLSYSSIKHIIINEYGEIHKQLLADKEDNKN